MRKLIITLGLLTLSATAQSLDPRDSMAREPFESTITAGDLAAACQFKGHYPAGQCVGMIDGYVTALTNFKQVVIDDKVFNISLEPHVTRLQVVHVFLAHINKHPELENQPCYAELVHALTDAKLLHSTAK